MPHGAGRGAESDCVHRGDVARAPVGVAVERAGRAGERQRRMRQVLPWGLKNAARVGWAGGRRCERRDSARGRWLDAYLLNSSLVALRCRCRRF